MHFSLTLPKEKLKDHPIDKEINPQLVMEEIRKKGHCRKRFPDGRQYDYELWTYVGLAQDSDVMVDITIPDELIIAEWEQVILDSYGKTFMIPEHVLKKAVVSLVSDEEMLLNAKWALDNHLLPSNMTLRGLMDQCSREKLAKRYSERLIRAYLETKDELLLHHPRSIQVDDPQIAKKLHTLAESFDPNESNAVKKIDEALDHLEINLSDIQKRDFLRFSYRFYESKIQKNTPQNNIEHSGGKS